MIANGNSRNRIAYVSTLFALVFAAAGIALVGRQQPDGVDTLKDRITVLEGQQAALEQELRDFRNESKALGNTFRAPVAPPRASLPAEPVNITRLPVAGSPGAGLAIIEYSDFQCPYCKRHFQDTFPLIDRDYIKTGRVRYIFHNMPLERLHPRAADAAAATVCAQGQGKFWDMRERLFESKAELTADALSQLARGLGLDMRQFDRCIASEARSVIDAQAVAAADLGVASTPTFFIGRVESDGQVRVIHRIAGALPFAVFRGVIDRLENN